METVEVGAEHAIRVEVGQGTADLVSVRTEHGGDRLVHINDLAVVVGHHDVTGNLIEGNADADGVDRALLARCCAGSERVAKYVEGP